MKKNKWIIVVIVGVVLICVLLFVKNKRKSKSENKEDNTPKASTSSTKQEEKKENDNYVKLTQDGTQVNTSKKFAEKKIVNGIEFTNIQFTEKNGETILIATVKNTGSEKTEMFSVDITLLDKNGGEITKFPGLVAPLEAGGTSQFSSSITLNYIEAYDFKVEAK